ncbi:MAG: polyphosphate kinase 1 [Candidatus Omnitrophica bacterium]|nr:polyphosphate kinase 1 [Candidatus Omnitrophota bacterium]
METKEKFIHRDLSWIEFNRRVLEEAADEYNPLLERIKFLAIFTSNLDEFFMVRMSGAQKLLASGYNKRDQFGYYPQELYAEIKTRTDDLVKRFYEIYQGPIRDALEGQKILIKKPDQFNEEQKKFAQRFLETTLYPIITPMAVDGGHPFPVLPSRTIAFAVNINRSGKNHLAIIPVPQSVPRLLKLPAEGDESVYTLTDYLIKENLAQFFKGYTVDNSSLFRVLRDSELEVDEGFAPDLLKALEKELKKRSSAKPVYLQMEAGTNKELLEALCQGIDFNQEEVVFAPSDLDLTFLYDLYAWIDKALLRNLSFTPAKSVYENIFDKIKEEDFIIHVPFQSFLPTSELIAAAAKDPDVLAIKMTLYRTNEDSAIIKALMEAARRRKQVTVVVEIKARFEEEKNIQWSRELEQEGCHVIYGIAGLKIHSKMTLIVRKEEGRIRRYVHLSTGNYNEKTANVYTDIGFFTANDDFARDIADVFNVITGYSLPSPWKRVISSPHDLRKYFFDLIDREIKAQQEYKNGLIIAKMNSLEDTQIIEKLYAASCAGVKIKLIVRGICCLVPGVVGLSENIEVRSIVGRFLEHSRIFYFNNNGNGRVFLSSADWMTRNFDRRIELLFEITKPEIKSHLQFILDNFFKDTRKVRFLRNDRSWGRIRKEGAVFEAQEYFINHYSR